MVTQIFERQIIIPTPAPTPVVSSTVVQAVTPAQTQSATQTVVPAVVSGRRATSLNEMYTLKTNSIFLYAPIGSDPELRNNLWKIRNNTSNAQLRVEVILPKYLKMVIPNPFILAANSIQNIELIPQPDFIRQFSIQEQKRLDEQVQVLVSVVNVTQIPLINPKPVEFN